MVRTFAELSVLHCSNSFSRCHGTGDNVTLSLGDPDLDAEALTQRSPVSYADAITAPLFILQGARDPRVPRAESDQLVTRLRDRGVDVRYEVFEDEGHGFTSRSNELRAYEEISQFLCQHLL